MREISGNVLATFFFCALECRMADESDHENQRGAVGVRLCDSLEKQAPDGRLKEPVESVEVPSKRYSPISKYTQRPVGDGRTRRRPHQLPRSKSYRSKRA